MAKSFDQIIVFTDGSCSGNGKKCARGGYGIYFPCSEFNNTSDTFTIAPITNQRTELYAIYKALKQITENCEFNKIFIYSDSLYSINCVTLWVKNWEKNNWLGSDKKEIKNLDIIQPIHNIITNYNGKIIFRHVKAHTGNDTIEAIFNDRVDKLACEGTAKNCILVNNTAKNTVKKSTVKKSTVKKNTMEKNTVKKNTMEKNTVKKNTVKKSITKKIIHVET